MRKWTPAEHARIEKRRTDPAWELATEEEMARTPKHTDQEREIRAEYARDVLCHEADCPDAWKDSKQECKWCGQEFVPTHPDQDCCSMDCVEAYYSEQAETGA